MFYTRQIYPSLQAELNTKEATVLTGMRQVGKTTLLQELYSSISSSNKIFLDFENPFHTQIFEKENFDDIWMNLAEFGIRKEERAYIFIDEAQNLPIISRVIKYLVDHYQTKFFITGSSSFYLKNLFPESMAGRKLIFELYPLTFAEFLTFKGVKREIALEWEEKIKEKNKIRFERLASYYTEYLSFGGFPAVVLETNRERKKALLEGIFKAYFEKDVKTLADFKDRGKLRDLILLLCPRIASQVEIGKLAAELSLSRETVYNYLSFLEQTYFIKFLPKFSRSIDRSSAGRQKLFFTDTGLANFLGKLSPGQSLENSVFQNLRTEHQLSFFLQEDREIDFIVDGQVAIEVKTFASDRDVYTLRQRATSLKIKKYYVVTQKWGAGEQIIQAADL